MAHNKSIGDLGFEQKLWLSADKLRSNMDASEYKHVVLGLIFLKYISDAFKEVYKGIAKDPQGDPEDIDEYKAKNVFWVPKEARWDNLQKNAKQPKIGTIIDDAMDAIEKENPSLRGVLPKDYARPALDKQRLGELIDLISSIALGDKESRSKDILGRVYEYFLGQFADAEGKKGGQFYTPRCIVKLLVEMIEPYKGRVFDPCCGSGGMFVQSEKFVENHSGRINDISIFGQESNPTTWRLCKMNLAIRGIDSTFIKWNNEGSFLNDEHRDLKADYIIANPPFNDSDWKGEQLREDIRWKYGVPPTSNANFGWVQHFIHHLAPHGIAGFVLANGSLSSNNGDESEIKKKLIENDIVDCIVAIPSKLFYNTTIPACLWFVSKDKQNNKFRNRKGEVLFIDARKLGRLISRSHREFSEEDIKKISDTYHKWKKINGGYQDELGFSKSVTVDAIKGKKSVLIPSLYIDYGESEKEDILEDRTNEIVELINEKEKIMKALDEKIRKAFEKQGYNELSSLSFKSMNKEHIEQLAKSLFTKWIINFEFPNENNKPYLSNNGAMEDSEIIGAKVPRGWTVEPLDKIAEFLNGLPLQKYPQKGKDFLPVIKIKELKTGVTKNTDKADTNINPKYIIKNGDIIFSWSGSLELVVWNHSNGALNQHLFKVTSEKYPKWFFFYWIKNYLSEFRNIASGKATTMGHIQRYHLTESQVLIPTKKQLEKMNEILEPLFQLYTEKNKKEN